MQHSYQVGNVVFRHWKIVKFIGEGSFGSVYELQRVDFDTTYKAALKVISVPQSQMEVRSIREEGMGMGQTKEYFYSMVQEIVNEFALMSKLKGTGNIVNYEDHEVIPSENFAIGWDILIRMELLTPVLTHAYENPFTHGDVIKLGIDMCKSLELCQKYNIIHRDIKPENIFVSHNGDYKLGDFGIARTVEKTMAGLSKKGTYSYMAPEVYCGLEYGFSVDIYSLGIVLYRLLNQNRTPFLPEAPAPISYSDREKALAMRINGQPMPAPFYNESRLSEIVLKACAHNPKDRYSSPVMMRQELEAIQYDMTEAEVIYPTGDKSAAVENIYMSKIPQRYQVMEDSEKTESIFDIQSVGDTDKTESVFSYTKNVKNGRFHNELSQKKEKQEDGKVIFTDVKEELSIVKKEKQKRVETKGWNPKTKLVGGSVLLIAFLIVVLGCRSLILGRNVINWEDPVIEAICREALDILDGDISVGEVECVTSIVVRDEGFSVGFVNGTRKDILLITDTVKTINDLSCFKNLKTLYLSGQRISDISVLSELEELMVLDLSDNYIVDISVLSELENLSIVYLEGNDITDWSPVEHVKTVWK